MDVRDIIGKGLCYKQISEIPFNTDIGNISRRNLLPYGTTSKLLQRGIKALRKGSITYLIVQQGVLRFVSSIITDKTPFLGVGVNLQGCISTLLVCRFFLDVRELNSSCDAINSTNNLVVTTFRAAVRSTGNSLIEDVGDAYYTGNFILSPPHEGELPDHSAEGCEETSSHGAH
ncbi:hypothetical protein BU17DRAFT_67636 [Hysterangium stoloniferum]|nr:hypothetical protein BU17DRAFT_67636 [Hysterangium stoloniferum]